MKIFMLALTKIKKFSVGTSFLKKAYWQIEKMTYPPFKKGGGQSNGGGKGKMLVGVTRESGQRGKGVGLVYFVPSVNV